MIHCPPFLALSCLLEAVKPAFYIGEPVLFRTSDTRHIGAVVVIDTDRVVIHDSNGPRPVYYVVARNTVERYRDEDADDTAPSKRHKTCDPIVR